MGWTLHSHSGSVHLDGLIGAQAALLHAACCMLHAACCMLHVACLQRVEANRIVVLFRSQLPSRTVGVRFESAPVKHRSSPQQRRGSRDFPRRKGDWLVQHICLC